MSIRPCDLRVLINERLALLVNPEFAYATAVQQPDGVDAWGVLKEALARLHNEKAAFFDRHGYGWALGVEAYGSPFEGLLQWRLLNALSDIHPDHPDLERCSNLVVRILPSSCARPHLRQVEQYRVIVLTSGYLSAFKGFIRLWLRGCALGGVGADAVPTAHREYAASYLAGISKAERTMAQSAFAYVGTLLQLLDNRVPVMDRESIFDEQVLKRERWQVQFGTLGTAIDGFILFHEAAHVLAGDTPVADRSLKTEVSADCGSVSLCIIDEARGGGFGTVHRGGPMFFCVELLRLLVEETMEVLAGRHDPTHGRYAGITELMLRSRLYGEHVSQYLGTRVQTLYNEWTHAMALVFDTVRWALLHRFGKQIPLSQFVVPGGARTAGRAG